MGRGKILEEIKKKVKTVAEQNSWRKIGAIRKGELVELMGK